MYGTVCLQLGTLKGEGLTGRKVRRQYEYDFRTLQKEEETSYDLPGSMGPLGVYGDTLVVTQWIFSNHSLETLIGDDRTLRRFNELSAPSGLSQLFSFNLTCNRYGPTLLWHVFSSQSCSSHDSGMSKWYAHVRIDVVVTIMNRWMMRRNQWILWSVSSSIQSRTIRWRKQRLRKFYRNGEPYRRAY